MTNRKARNQRVRNLALAAVAGQAGCITLMIIFGALFLGLWFDARFGQQGFCIVGMLILSVPFSLYAMLRIAMAAISRIQSSSQTQDETIDPQLVTKE